MKRRIIIVAFCYFVISYGYAQKKELKGIINYPELKDIEIIPYTGPTGPTETVQKKYNQNKINSKSFKSQIIDSLVIEDIIPQGSNYTIKYNYHADSIALKKISPLVNLTDSAVIAIACSPKWLQTDLYDNFRKLSPDLQNKYARCIINSDTLYRDEVAFQIAHLAPNYTLYYMNPVLLAANAKGIYQIAPDLQYVKLTEHGSARSGDWYTTTEYRIIDSKGDSVWREIPRDIYYWWVVMPVIFEEFPYMDSTVYNEFWRTYIYKHADSAFPVLRDVLEGVKVFWDGRNTYLGNSKSFEKGLPFNDSLFAVQAIGRWVAQTIPTDAEEPRPIQPNQILHWHHGNCGEIQVLQTAGARAGLIPVVPICTWPGDHTWDEVYWPDSAKWAFYQVDRVCGPTTVSWNHTLPEKACITAWRADGYRWMVNEHYNPVCTLTVVVQDIYGKPIDGAEVFFLAANQSDTRGACNVIGSWGHTDENGELTVLLGTNINYAIRADWENGHIPVKATQFFGIYYTTLPEGGKKWMHLTAGGTMPEDAPHNSVSDTTFDKYSIVVEYSIAYHTVYGWKYWQNYNFWQDVFMYAHKIDGGKISSFICDSVNFYKYSQDTLFNACTYLDTLSSGWMGFDMPGKKDFYISFSNRSRENTSKFARIKVYLLNGPTSISNFRIQISDFRIYPNPTEGIINIVSYTKENATVEILNSFGQVVYKTYFNKTANNRKLNLSAEPKGIYLVRIYNKEITEVKKLIIQ